MSSILQTASVFVTGGAGTLGRAIARRRQKEGWTGRFTVYSRDEHKHSFMRKMFPDVQYVQGDIRNLETLKLAMAGHDVVLHCGATKVIPVSEYSSIDTLDVNVYGSQNVCIAAREMGVSHVLGISTDKACHPASAYGATKMLMEKIFQEYARAGSDTQFHLVRYGNVLESTGSVVEAWTNAVAMGEPVKITDPDMTRFWLSPSQAVDYVIGSLEFLPGLIYVPKMPGLSIDKLLGYVVGEQYSRIETIPLRPGEKMHETLVTGDELSKTVEVSEGECEYFMVFPSTSDQLAGRKIPLLDPKIHQKLDYPAVPYTSDIARELTEAELEELLKDE